MTPDAVWSALQGDGATLEIAMARIHAVLAGFALLICLYFTLLVDSRIAAPLTAFASWSVVWFLTAWVGMRRGWAVGVFAWVNPVVEMLIPGFALLFISRFESPEYALGSWVPPQMFALYIAASVLRLRPAVPLAMGALAAVEYGAVYWLEMRPHLAADTVLWARPQVQLVRMFTLLAIGAVGSGAVLAFRDMVGRASQQVRARGLFGKYQLGRQIASGGMGTVFEAVYCPEGGFQRRVAVKRIHPHLAQNQDFVARFRHEAELCARLAHPNIVAALDFGKVSDTYFFAMEYIDGVTLKTVLYHRRLTEDPMAPADVCWLLRQVLEGLAFAHAGARDSDGQLLRVVHRDLSPHNVLLDRSGQVKVSDFGVARALRDDHDLNTRNLAGKPAYMAPEQLRKAAIDERSDLFGVGVIAWEALTNRRLFFRDNEAATMLAVLEAPILPPSRLRPELGSHWDRFCARALARPPLERFQTAAGMLQVLAEIQDLEGPAGPEEMSALVRISDEDALPELELQ